MRRPYRRAGRLFHEYPGVTQMEYKYFICESEDDYHAVYDLGKVEQCFTILDLCGRCKSYSDYPDFIMYSGMFREATAEEMEKYGMSSMKLEDPEMDPECREMLEYVVPLCMEDAINDMNRYRALFYDKPPLNPKTYTSKPVEEQLELLQRFALEGLTLLKEL